MMTDYRYGILGAGRQGTAAAYDLIVHGEADSVVLGDADAAAASAAAEHVNRLTGRHSAKGVRVDAFDHAALVEFLRPLDAFLSAVPFKLNLRVTHAALEARTHMCDLGGNSDVVARQLALDSQARQQGICIVPDCGLSPGASTNLVAYVIGLFDEAEEVLLFDGGLPLRPRPPWNYELTFHIEGLTNEYHGTTTYLVDGQAVQVEAFSEDEYELVEFPPPFGTLEAYVTTGGLTTAVETLRSRVRTLKNKTLRYPGHVAQFKAFRDAGFFEETPITLDGVEVIPRHVFHALIEPKIRATEATRDAVVTRLLARGSIAAKAATATLDVFIYYDERLGFTAMQQGTGWHAAIVCHQMASGRIKPGATPVEIALDAAEFPDELRQRGFEVTETVEVTD